MSDEFRDTLVGIYITCSIFIIGTNLFMMGVILYSPALRLVPRNALIVGICVADLLMGSFVTPMFTRTLVESKFPDCHTHLALQVRSLDKHPQCCRHSQYMLGGIGTLN
ncbi:hypothetical protein ElyMa_003839000 [Elysia marginata]|uniref:G-protein coupled receptors family 1 profile domain-containing protein n=1 Tax=Elysia marginata TaxID=1093978 RepID=A0AAV4FHK9_9GAST|nr:hypothetical protein ElyMa_003839000 [Elysia marginata]